MTLNIYESLIHWLLRLLKHFLHFIIFMIIKTIIKVIASKNGGIFVFFSSVTLKKKTQRDPQDSPEQSFRSLKYMIIW